MEFDDSLHGGPCPLCLNLGQNWLLKLSPLNDEEAVFFCKNPECAYPIGSSLDVKSEWVVPFKLKDWIRQSIRKRHTTGSSGIESSERPCSNLANTSASDSPLCHLSSTQTSPALSTISTISNTSSKQPKVSPAQQYSLNTPGALDADCLFQGNLEAGNSTSIGRESTLINKTYSSLTGLSLFDIDNGTSENRQNNENVEQHTESDSSLNVTYTKDSGKAHDRPGQNNNVVINKLEGAYKGRIGDKLNVCTNDEQQSKYQISASSHDSVQIQNYDGSFGSDISNASVQNFSSNCETGRVFRTNCTSPSNYAKPVISSRISQLPTSPSLYNIIEQGALNSYFPLSSMVEVVKPFNNVDDPVSYDIDEGMKVLQEIEQTEEFLDLDDIPAAGGCKPVDQVTMLSCSGEALPPINIETPSFSVYSDLDISYSFDSTNQQQSIYGKKVAGSGKNCGSLQNGNRSLLEVMPVEVRHNEFDFEKMMEADDIKTEEEFEMSLEGAKNDSEVGQNGVIHEPKKEEFPHARNANLQKLMKHFQRKLEKCKHKNVKPKVDVIDKKEHLNVSLTENSGNSTSPGNEVVLYSGTLVIDNIDIGSTLETPMQYIPQSVSSDKTQETSVEQTSMMIDGDAKAADINQPNSIVNIVQCHSKDPNVCFEYCVSLEGTPKSTSSVSKFDKDSDKVPAEESEPSDEAKISVKIENMPSEASSSVVEKSTDLTPNRYPSKVKKRNTSESLSAATKTQILKAYAELEVKCGRNWKSRTRSDSSNLTDLLGVQPLDPCHLERPVKKYKHTNSTSGGRSRRPQNK